MMLAHVNQLIKLNFFDIHKKEKIGGTPSKLKPISPYSSDLPWITQALQAPLSKENEFWCIMNKFAVSPSLYRSCKLALGNKDCSRIIQAT